MPLTVRSPSPLAPGVATGFGEVKMAPSPNTRFSSVVEDLQPRRLRAHACETLYAFEDHARECDLCNDPHRVHRRGGRLCAVGHDLACKVEDLIFSKHDGTVFYSQVAGADHHLIRIELPPDCGQVISLLRAVERSLRHPELPRIVSQDAHYYVAPRPVARHASLRARRDPSPPRRRQDGTSSHDFRRSGILRQRTQEVAPAGPSARPPIPPPAPDAPPNTTNFRHATVEDGDDGDDSIYRDGAASMAPPSPQSTAPSTTRAMPSLRRTETLPTRDSAGPRLPPSAPRTRQQAPPRSPSASQRQRTTPLPEAPEPPVRTERATPTEFAYTTQVREPPPSAYRQPARGGVPPIRRRSMILPFR